MNDRLRLGWAAFLLFLSVWTVLPSPIPGIWYLTVGAPEYGHFIALATVPLWWPGAGRRLVPAILVLALWPAVAAGASPVKLFSPGPRRVEVTTSEYAPGRKVDLYPAGGKLGVLVVHGGSWARGDRKEFAGLNHYLAGLGYTVAAIDYRLAPEHRYPAALDDVHLAAAWLRGRVDKLVLLGRSAGGHLALLAAYQEGVPAVEGVIAFYPPTDMVWSYEHPSNRAVLDSRAALRDFLGGTPEEVPALYEQASPLQHAGAFSPPTLLIHGLRDDLVFPEQSRRLARALGARARLLELPWANHSGDINYNGPMGQTSRAAVTEFLARVQKGEGDE